MQYYFDYRFADTIMYMYVSDCGNLCSMIHVNLLAMRVQGKTVLIPYIVGVATQKPYQRQGWMAKLMQRVIADGACQKVPFLLLKTEQQAYYQHLGFQPVHWQEYYVMRIKQKRYEHSRIENEEQAVILGENGRNVMQIAKQQDLELIANWAENRLPQKYAIYVLHTVSYVSRMQKEYQAQQGDILVIRKDGKISGYVCYTMSSEEVTIAEYLSDEKEELVFAWLQEYFYNSKGLVLETAVERTMPVTMACRLEREQRETTANKRIAGFICIFQNVIHRLGIIKR